MRMSREYQLQLPARQQIVHLWLEQLCKENTNTRRAQLEPLALQATGDFYHYLDVNEDPQRFDLQRFVGIYLSTENPSIVEVARIFIMMRSAFRKLLISYDVPSGFHALEQLDNWTDLVVSRYALVHSRLIEAREARLAERMADLAMLNHCVALLNGSLDTVSVVNMAAQLACEVTGADLCIVFKRERDLMVPLASAGQIDYAGEPVAIADPKSLEPLIVDENQADLPLEKVCQSLGVSGIRAVTCSPLRAGSAVIGKLAAVYLQPQRFTQRQLDVREIYASYAGQALRNAQLYERLAPLTAAQERQRIAMEMHDTMLQTLVTLNINLQVAMAHIRDADWVGAQQCVEAARQLGKAAVVEGRETLRSLNSGCSSEETLFDAIEAEMQLFEEQTGIMPELIRNANHPPCVSDVVRHHLRRLIGESLNNIQRHARATEVKITIEETHQGLMLKVEDNGLGFDSDQIDEQRSFGLNGMRERSRLIHAQLEVQASPGNGTAVVVRMPLKSGSFPGKSDFS